MAFPEIICEPSCRSCLLQMDGHGKWLSDLVPSGAPIYRYYFNVEVRQFNGQGLIINFRFEIDPGLIYPVYFFVYPLFSNEMYIVTYSFTGVGNNYPEIILYDSSTVFSTKKVTSEDKFNEWGTLDRIDKDYNARKTFKFFTENRNYSREAATAVVAIFDCLSGLNPANNLVPKRMIPDINELAENGQPKYGLLSAINYGFNEVRAQDIGYKISCVWQPIHISPQYYYFLRPNPLDPDVTYWQIIYDRYPVALPEPLPDDYYYDNGVGLLNLLHRTYATYGSYPELGTTADYRTFYDEVFIDNFMTLDEQLPRMANALRSYIPNWSSWKDSRENPAKLAVKILENPNIERYIGFIEEYNYKRCLETKACYWYQQLAKQKCKNGSPFWVYLKWQYP